MEGNFWNFLLSTLIGGDLKFGRGYGEPNLSGFCMRNFHGINVSFSYKK